MRRSVYITAERLAARLRWKNPPVILDVRWSLAEPNGYPAHLAGRIPGSVYVDLDTELSAKVGEGTGRHPLPEIADLQEAARSWGINDGDTVVVYDDDNGAAASRAWWVLRWAGIEDVRILDGGYPTWAGHGRTVEGFPKPRRRKDYGNVTLSPGHLPTLEAEDVAAFGGVLIDARAPERFSGEFEPMEDRAGHIPGAVNHFFGNNIGEDGLLLREEDLREQFTRLGAMEGAPVAVYCGSGVSAAHNVAALASLGIEASLYPGSWSQWSTDPDRPVATGV